MSFTVYRSSAGSGKTFTLVKEYLKIALSDDMVPPRQFRHIIAITFTNKAAAEMKERVIRSLKLLSENDPASGAMAKAISEETYISRDEIATRAKNLLESILHQYSDLSIGTIDSFVHRIIRTFSHDLSLPFNFEIEIDEEKLQTQAIDLLLSEAGSDSELSRFLIDYSAQQVDGEKHWNIAKDLLEFTKNFLKEENAPYLEKLDKLSLADFIEIRASLIARINAMEAKLSACGKEGVELMKANGITMKDLYQGDKGVSRYFYDLATLAEDRLEPNKNVLTTLHENKWYSKTTPGETVQRIESVKDSLSSILENAVNIIDSGFADYILCKLVMRNLNAMALGKEIRHRLSFIKKEGNVILIGELNELISAIVRDQPSPFIYERIGVRYRNFLIDEFQDTSSLQWQNVLPLIHNSLSEGNFNLIVGDGKQAIYRWRGGDVMQFRQLPAVHNEENNPIIKERASLLKSNYSEKQLTRNFRSKTELIAFNNSFFSGIAETLPPLLGTIYENHIQESDPANKGGAVSILFMPGEEKKKKDSESDRCIAQIHQLKKEGFQYRDIAILFRSNAQGAILANRFEQEGIPVVSQESLLISNSVHVRLLVSAAMAIHDPQNKLGIAGIARALFEMKSIDLMETLESRSFYAGQFRGLPVYEMMEALIRYFQLDQTGEAYLTGFLDEVHQYSQRFGNSLGDFLEWWEERSQKAAVGTAEGSDAVTLMTIHKAKGLEFPAVILPYCNWEIDMLSDTLWIDLKEKGIDKLETALVNTSKKLEKTSFALQYNLEKERTLLDNINVLYVALTRASERMIILTSVPAGRKRLSQYFINYLNAIGKWEPAKLHYHFGAEVTTRKSLPVKPVAEPVNQISGTWRDRLFLRQRYRHEGFATGMKNTRTRGILIHAALAEMETADDRAKAVDVLVKKGLLPAEQKEELMQELNRILANKDVAELFSFPDSKKEKDILLPGGDILRPDRFINLGEKAILVDFKTGAEREADVQQMEGYRLALTDLGYKNLEIRLVYTGGPTIKKV